MTDIIYDYYIPTKIFLEEMAKDQRVISYKTLIDEVRVNLLPAENWEDNWQLSRLLDTISISTYYSNQIFLSSMNTHSY